MKLIRTLPISETEFYDYLEQDMLAECKSLNGISVLQKGARYSNQAKDIFSQIQLEVLDYQRNSHYQARLISYTDHTIVSYHTKVVGEQELEIVFSQKINSLKKKRYSKLFSWFSDGVYLGRMSDSLYAIQTAIIKKRKKSF